MKTIAIVFSDLHINNWAKFNDNNQRTLNHFKVLDRIAKVCEKNNCPALFCGDMFNKPENMDQSLHHLIESEFKRIGKEHPTFKCYAISGNHELQKVNKVGVVQESWIHSFKVYGNWLEVLDFDTKLIAGKYKIYGIPYIDHNIGLCEYLNKLELSDKKNILLLHTDYPGAKDTDGREVGSVENLNLNTLNKFDLVLCGHIHKPQKLSKKVYMIGSPLQQRRTDSDCKLGYWVLYEDLSMEFKELTNFPKFIDVESEDDIKADGNYYTVLPKKITRESSSFDHKITKQLSKRSLAKQYMKEKGIKDSNKKKLLIDILKKAELC
jgi:DNA repair exonuclease SbcCD nuclease subunit